METNGLEGLVEGTTLLKKPQVLKSISFLDLYAVYQDVKSVVPDIKFKQAYDDGKVVLESDFEHLAFSNKKTLRTFRGASVQFGNDNLHCDTYVSSLNFSIKNLSLLGLAGLSFVGDLELFGWTSQNLGIQPAISVFGLGMTLTCYVCWLAGTETFGMSFYCRTLNKSPEAIDQFNEVSLKLENEYGQRLKEVKK